jgi:hypothetical protein
MAHISFYFRSKAFVGLANLFTFMLPFRPCVTEYDDGGGEGGKMMNLFYLMQERRSRLFILLSVYFEESTKMLYNYERKINHRA